MGAFLPCPPALKETIAGFAGPENTAEQIALAVKEEQNLELHGSKNWYDWQVDHWGTKWDIGRDQDQLPRRLPSSAKQITLSFQSAWSPPTQFFNYMRNVEGFDVTAYFFEPGVGFCGFYKDGKVKDFNSPCDQEDLDKLPPDLVKTFELGTWVAAEYGNDTDEEEN